MKKLKLFLASFLFCSFANGQAVDQNTGNLITPNNWWGTTVVNDVTALGCCTGGPQPAYSLHNNSINFSYGYYNVAQLIDFNTVQALSAAGIVIKGFNYSWTISNNSRNGADPISAGIGLYSPIGNNLEYYVYNHDYQSGTFSGTQNFTSQYTLNSARYLQLNFWAYDQGYWAGYYGPTVTDISLSINYAVDQCTSNPLYSPDCAGYQQAYTQLQCSANALYSTSCPGYEQAYLDQQCTASPLYSTSCPGYAAAFVLQQMATQKKEESSPAATTVASVSKTTTSEPVQDVTSTSTEVKTDVGGAEITTSGAIKAQDGVPEVVKESIPQASSPATRETQERKTVNSNALSVARNAVAAAEATARSVVSESISQSLSENANPSDGIGSSALGSGLVIIGLGGNSFQQEQASSFRGYQTPSSDSFNVETTDQNKSGSTFENINTSITAYQEQRQETNDTVKKNVQDNELSGEVSIATIAVVPVGYSAYTAAVVRDAPFYAPKEIYKNQKVVDNQRAQRILSGASDRKHQEMVDGQYKPRD